MMVMVEEISVATATITLYPPPLSCDILAEGQSFQLSNIVVPAPKTHAQAEEQHTALQGLSEKLRSAECVPQHATLLCSSPLLVLTPNPFTHHYNRYRVLLLLKIAALLSATSMVRARALYASSLFYFSRAARNRQQQGGAAAPLRPSDKNDAVLCEQVRESKQRVVVWVV